MQRFVPADGAGLDRSDGCMPSLRKPSHGPARMLPQHIFFVLDGLSAGRGDPTIQDEPAPGGLTEIQFVES
jgi:hypothetical protein